MKICFVAAGPPSWGSSRMRAYWPARHLGAAVVRFGRTPPPADVYIWQKQADVTHIRAHPDALHIWDLCDPLHWFSPHEAREIAGAVNGVTASSTALARDLRHWLGEPVEVIPDIVEPGHFGHRRRHTDAEPLRFIWFGVAVNRVALAGAWANLARLAANGHRVELTILDDRPDVPLGYGGEVPVYQQRWSLDHEAATLAAHDVALLPPYPGPWGQVKSDNKAMTASWAGLPVVDGHNYDELLAILDVHTRVEVAQAQWGQYTHRTAARAAEWWQEVVDRWTSW